MPPASAWERLIAACDRAGDPLLRLVPPSHRRRLIYLGLAILVAAFVRLLRGGPLFSFGSMPGDIYHSSGGFTFSFPIVSSVVASVLLSLLANAAR